MKRRPRLHPAATTLDAPRLCALSVWLWRERMKKARRCPPDTVDMAACAFDAAMCLDAPDVMPAGSMRSGEAWTYLATVSREAQG